MFCRHSFIIEWDEKRVQTLVWSLAWLSRLETLETRLKRECNNIYCFYKISIFSVESWNDNKANGEFTTNLPPSRKTSASIAEWINFYRNLIDNLFFSLYLLPSEKCLITTLKKVAYARCCSCSHELTRIKTTQNLNGFQPLSRMLELLKNNLLLNSIETIVSFCLWQFALRFLTCHAERKNVLMIEIWRIPSFVTKANLWGL